jgi:hypothetical protein
MNMTGIRSWRGAAAFGLACVLGLHATPRGGPALAQEKGGPGLSAAEFESLWRDLHVRRQPWATIPWRASVTEARALAAETHRPIFMVVNSGNCLGFV